MKNLYYAAYAEFNWVFVFIFLIVGVVAMFHMRKNGNLKNSKKVFAIYAVVFLLSVLFVISSNKRFFSNDILNMDRVVYEGGVKSVEYGNGFEVVEISGVFLPRSKYKHGGYPKHCWTGDFSKHIINNKGGKFRIEVYWIKGGQRNLKYFGKYTNDFPCILRVDLIDGSGIN